nr:MAG TPA: hypothetical protein [Caudoviricetes sp.]
MEACSHERCCSLYCQRILIPCVNENLPYS